MDGVWFIGMSKHDGLAYIMGVDIGSGVNPS